MTIDLALKVVAIALLALALYGVTIAPKKLSAVAMWNLAVSIANIVVQWTQGNVKTVAVLATFICMLFWAIAAIAAMIRRGGTKQ